MTWLKQNWFKIIAIQISLLAVFLPTKTFGYGECSDYGIWATYDYLSGNCKCMSGYVFGKDFLGNTTCVDGDSVCYDKYGYNSRYDSLSNSCKCSYGYVFGTDSIGRTQCISENQACQNQYGYNAQSSFGDKCECRSGYEFTQTGSGLECKSCFSKYGLNSSYDYLSKQCECDDGYTLKDGQCVEKQNNVYFTLKELDTDDREAIIKSDYDLRYYFVRYNSGCYSSSFRRYLNDRIVVNLGTDFDLDTWDRIVLQDDNETCDITYKERVDSGFTLEEGEEEISYIPIFSPATTNISPKTTTPAPTSKLISTPNIQAKCNKDSVPSSDNKRCIKLPENAHPANNGKDIWLCNEGFKEVGNNCFAIQNDIVASKSENAIQDELAKDNFTFIDLLKMLRFWRWF